LILFHNHPLLLNMKQPLNLLVPVRRFRPVLSILALLILAAAPLGAQQLVNGAQSETSYNWLTPNAALVKLQNELQQEHQQLPSLAPGSPLHIETLRRIAYFKSVIRTIQAGTAVHASLEASLPAAATLGGQQEVAFTAKTVLRALFEETRNMLTY
jgi:hypothetical protein